MEINVLVLSAGRRVELINCFQEAARKLQIKSNIIAADCSNTAPALYFADKKYIIPRIDSGKYIQAVIDICIKENISLVIPTIDTELLILSENKAVIERSTKAKVLISNVQVIDICRNKHKTQAFLESKGFFMPRLYSIEDINKHEINYPLFIKPTDGSSSINTYKICNDEELAFYMRIVPNPIVQEFVDGDEYTVDTFSDFDSNVIHIVPRKRIATRSGEISKGRISKDRDIINNVKELLDILRPIGQATIQCIKTKRGIVYIEINPRFGGGAPMSIKAGADSCSNLYRLIAGEELTYNENYQEDLTFLRYDSSICIDGNMELVQ